MTDRDARSGKTRDDRGNGEPAHEGLGSRSPHRAGRRARAARDAPRGAPARRASAPRRWSAVARRSPRCSTAKTTACSSSPARAASTIPRRRSTTLVASPRWRRDLGDDLLVAMRVYFEKPRTTVGWKGLINDPHLDGSGDVNSGLRIARELLLDVLDVGLLVGCEFLDPITPQYIADAVAWGAIGARTSESQTHRQLGSGLSMPIGFKNRTDGNVQVAVDAVRAAGAQHAFAGIDDAGAPAILYTTGNPRWPRDPARRRRGAELRRRRRSRGGRAASRGGPARAAGDRRLARQQRQGPRPPGDGGGRDRRAGFGRQPRDRRGDARVVHRRRPPGPRLPAGRSPTASRSPTPASTGSERR